MLSRSPYWYAHSLVSLQQPEMYGDVANPFPRMTSIFLQRKKTNFFEKCVDEYTKPLGIDTHQSPFTVPPIID
jgi:ribonucleotide reductase beta subunit family protein with ferritin-like domain